ncbi:MAG TPA: DUF362 domain-containing protein [Candidatus Limnocylindrales bacterium]|nr:DUF362 domain-containing protein [Candidatus Limnocylindrales bacterium]
MTRREWLALISATPLLRAADTPPAPAAPVAIAKCASYDEDVSAPLAGMFRQLGGLEPLVRNKTVTIKVNMTGAPSNRVDGKTPALTHYTHPKLLGATAYLLSRAGARRVRFVESAWATAGPLEDVMLDSGWNVGALKSAAPNVLFENTNARGTFSRYARFKVPGSAYMYPAYDLNQAYEETDVFISMAKLKNHATCGVTLSLKNCFGNLPASIYGDNAGVDEPNEKPTSGRGSVGHEGKRQPSKSAPQELHFGANHDPGYRVPHIVADLTAARPIHLAIIDGVQSIAGGEGPWVGKVRPVSPGVLIAGFNPVCTDAVATAVMGYNPGAQRGSTPFETCDNTLTLAEAHGLGTTNLKRIEVRGMPMEQALYRFSA